MTGWAGSTRKVTLPPDWEARRAAVFERDGHRCVYVRSTGRRCSERTRLECDHINDRDDHSLENLQTLCTWHHLRKSGGQGGKASAEARKQRTPFREPEPHPALTGKGQGPPWMRRLHERANAQEGRGANPA